MAINISTLKDAEELTALVNSAYRGESSARGWTSESHLLTGNRIDLETMLAYLTQSSVTILKHIDNKGDIIGCVYLEQKQDGLYLGMLSVNPDMQDHGIGRRLLNAADEFAITHHCANISISVISTRTELIAWYQRRGYVATGTELPFHVDEKFGKPNSPITLIEMKKMPLQKHGLNR